MITGYQYYTNDGKSRVVQTREKAEQDVNRASEIKEVSRPVIPIYITRITSDDFRRRFTVQETDAILAAFISDPFMRRLMNSTWTATEGVELTSPEVIGGVSYLHLIGILTAERKAEVLKPYEVTQTPRTPQPNP